MHFLGGGYIDIKPPGAGWNKAFDKLETTDSYYAVSQHIGPADISGAEEGGLGSLRRRLFGGPGSGAAERSGLEGGVGSLRGRFFEGPGIVRAGPDA